MDVSLGGGGALLGVQVSAVVLVGGLGAGEGASPGELPDRPDRHVPQHSTGHTQDFRGQSHSVSHPSFIFSSIFLQDTIRRRMVASLYVRLRSRAQY